MTGEMFDIIIIAIVIIVIAVNFGLSFAIVYSLAKYIKAGFNRILFGAFGCAVSTYIFVFGIRGANNASAVYAGGGVIFGRLISLAGIVCFVATICAIVFAELAIKKTLKNRDTKSDGA